MSQPAADYPDDENGHVLRDMAESGIDMTLLREIEFAHLAPDEVTAQKFADDVRSMGFDVAVHEPDEESRDDGETNWDVICIRRMVPSHREVTQVESELAERARKFGCAADGWGFLYRPSNNSLQ